MPNPIVHFEIPADDVPRAQTFYQNVFGIYAHSDGLDPSLIRNNRFEQNNIPGPSNGNGVYSDQGAGKFTIDADASRKEIEALVAQSQKRSAVYDVIANPVNVTVEVA